MRVRNGGWDESVRRDGRRDVGLLACRGAGTDTVILFEESLLLRDNSASGHLALVFEGKLYRRMFFFTGRWAEVRLKMKLFALLVSLPKVVLTLANCQTRDEIGAYSIGYFW